MRETLWLWIVLAACISACEPNFDEIRDTDQRSVTFEVDVSNMFANVLVPEGDGFVLGDNSGLDDHHRVRVTVRCYDLAGQLVDKSEIFTTLDDKPEMKFQHLDRNKQYSFIFLADVVEYYSDNDFYEIWYQLNDSKIEDLYLITVARSDTSKYNVIRTCNMTLTPENQKVAVELSPVTYNGYFVFTNMEGLPQFSCTYECGASFTLQNMKKTVSGTVKHEIDPTDGAFARIPFSASFADDNLIIRINGPSIVLNRVISNQCHRPFVVFVDCSTLIISDCVYY